MKKENEHSDQTLVEGCLKRNRKSQELLYRKYAPGMYTICLSYADQRSLAKDILQEGFIKVFANLSKFSGEGSLEGWIRKVIINTAIDHLRKNKRWMKHVELEERHIEQLMSNEIQEKIDTEDLIRYLGKLPDGARVIFNLYALEGYHHKEIAKILEISEGTSKSQFSRAKSLLQQMIYEESLKR